MSTDRIRYLNDLARTAMGVASRVVMTQGIAALGEQATSAIRERVERFNEFDAANDPYDEHDFGSFDFNGQKIFWKIDYYDRDLKFGSEDPSDPAITRRVLTLMLASEY